MMISCAISVAEVTMTLYRPSSSFAITHALNSSDHLARPFIGQCRKSFAKAQDEDATGTHHSSTYHVINHEKSAVAIVEHYAPYKRNPTLVMHIPTVTTVTRKL
jgi:hypothetical protein